MEIDAIPRSLSHAHRSVIVPPGASFWRKLLAFSGPGYLVAVGYMDPGNWATDLAGGSKFGYSLLAVVLLSNVFAMLLQYLSVKLGVATGRDLAQMCRQSLPRAVNVFLWLMAQVMIVACDLAEVIGTAIALELLFHIPLAAGVLITGADVLILLMLQKKGFRYLEALVIVLITTVVACFALEIALAHPAAGPLFHGFLPTTKLFTNHQMLLIAVGILGATVMPHNLYLHSATVQTRAHDTSDKGKREAIKFAGLDSTIALSIALFVNAAILILAAATFYMHQQGSGANIATAYKLLAPALGAAASTVFAIALLASGQNSTVTATLAGQVISEGFLRLTLKPWVQRLLTRALAIVPAVAIALWYGNTGITSLLILSQVILSMQLPFAILPLVFFTNSKKHMGPFANRLVTKCAAFGVAGIITGLNVWLVAATLS